MKKTSLLPILLFAILLSACNTEQVPWQDLFNGEDLTGWTQKNGEALYTIEDGVIVGTSVAGTPNSFLCTEKTYGDFILEFDVIVDNKLNSGVQIRSESYPEYNNSRVHGYQIEIDPSDRAWSAGVYDEGRRGWLYPLDHNPEGRGAFKLEEWNTYRVECIGANIKTWINGIACANLYDDMTAEGFIALQVHGIGNNTKNEGTTVKWKNLRIITENVEQYAKETSAPELSRLVNKLTKKESELGWKLLFDGTSTKGWRKIYGEAFPEKGWTVENGILTVLASDGAESENGGDIVTEQEYTNFDFQLEFRLTEGANSGIKYYVTESENNKGSAIGLEYQLLDDKKHPDALKGNHEGSRTLASLYDLIKASEDKKFFGIGAWNSARIISDHGHVEHYLNGIKVLEFERGSEEYRQLVSNSKYKVWESFGEAETGHILLQDHGNEVSFRSIKIMEL